MPLFCTVQLNWMLFAKTKINMLQVMPACFPLYTLGNKHPTTDVCDSACWLVVLYPICNLLFKSSSPNLMLILILALYTFEQYLELHQKYIAKEDKNLDGLVTNQGQLLPCFFWGKVPSRGLLFCGSFSGRGLIPIIFYVRWETYTS